MNTHKVHPASLGSSEGNHTPHCLPASKWLTLVNDNNVHAQTQHVKARVLKEQGGIPSDHVLVRDHGSDHDVAFGDDDMLDLAEGNVFFTAPHCAYHPKGKSNAPAKRAWFVDDRPAITLRPEQTGHTVRDLFGLDDAVDLFRDYMSPNDEPVGLNTVVRFADGPVFYSRHAEGPHHHEPIKIIVNGREKTVTEKKLTYAQVVRLGFDPVDPQTIYTVTYKKGPPANPQGSMVEGDTVKIECGMIFNVTPTRKS
jgi:Multiubiquitin